MQVLARVFIDFRFRKCLETFEKALADGYFFFACVFRFCGRNFNLLCFLRLEVGVVEALDQGGIHDGLAFVPFLDDCIHAVSVFFGCTCFEHSFEFSERFREACNFCLLFGFGIFCGLLFGVGFVIELVEAFVNFIERCGRFAHAKCVCFVHQFVELRLGGKSVLLGGEEVSLLDECFALALQEFGCLSAVVFGFLLCTNFIRNLLADGRVLGVLDEVGLQRFRRDAVCGLQCNFFAGIAGGDLGEQGLLAALLDKFSLQIYVVCCLEDIFSIARVLDGFDVTEDFAIQSGFIKVFQLFDDFFESSRFCQTAYAGIAVFCRNILKCLNNCKFLNCSHSHFDIIIGKGHSFNNILTSEFIQVGNGFDALCWVGILPFRFKCVKNAHNISNR